MICKKCKISPLFLESKIISYGINRTFDGITNRRATSAIWRIFAELNKPKRTLSKMNLTSMEVSMFSLCF